MEWLRHRWTRIVPIVLIGMMFGALAPQGFMPRYGDQGLSIILCSGSGPAAAPIDQADPLHAKITAIKAAMAGGPDRHDGENEGDSTPHCAYAGAAMATLLPAPPALTLPHGFAPLAPATVATIALSRHRAATPPATGPPVLI